MERGFLALALASGVVAVPTCQQADETTLLQGHIRHRSAHSLQPAHTKDEVADLFPNRNPAAVVAWIDANPESAAAQIASDTQGSADWVENNPEAGETIFNNHPELEKIMYAPWKQTLKMLENTKCLKANDSAGYYYNIKGSDTWVIWMEGGGGCSSPEECEEWGKGRSKWWESTHEGYGIQTGNCNRNPRFCNANHVFIPYCSGDTHQGQREDEHDGYHTSGHLNFQAIIADLIATTSIGSASRVLLTGSSAGGIGVISNADYLTDQLPGVTVKAAPIAGWFMPDETDDHDERWMMISSYEDHSADIASDPELALAMWAAQRDWAEALPGRCPKWKGAKCQNAPTRAAHVDTPMFVSENMWDSYHLERFNGVSRNPETWSEDQKAWLNYYARAMRASLERWFGRHEGNGLFLPATISHGGGIGRGLDWASINGHSYGDVLADWFYDDTLLPHKLIDACDSVEACFDV